MLSRLYILVDWDVKWLFSTESRISKEIHDILRSYNGFYLAFRYNQFYFKMANSSLSHCFWNIYASSIISDEPLFDGATEGVCLVWSWSTSTNSPLSRHQRLLLEWPCRNFHPIPPWICDIWLPNHDNVSNL